MLFTCYINHIYLDVCVSWVLLYFSHHFYKGKQFCDFFLFVSFESFSVKGSAFEGKNLLIEEQIISCKSSPLLRRKAEIKLTVLCPLIVK